MGVEVFAKERTPKNRDVDFAIGFEIGNEAPLYTSFGMSKISYRICLLDVSRGGGGEIWKCL